MEQSVSAELFMLIIAIGAILLFLYFVLFDRTSSHDVEIDNIYRKIEDNTKLSKDFNEALDTSKVQNGCPFDEQFDEIKANSLPIWNSKEDLN